MKPLFAKILVGLLVAASAITAGAAGMKVATGKTPGIFQFLASLASADQNVIEIKPQTQNVSESGSDTAPASTQTQNDSPVASIETNTAATSTMPVVSSTEETTTVTTTTTPPAATIASTTNPHYSIQGASGDDSGERQERESGGDD